MTYPYPDEDCACPGDCSYCDGLESRPGPHNPIDHDDQPDETCGDQ